MKDNLLKLRIAYMTTKSFVFQDEFHSFFNMSHIRDYILYMYTPTFQKKKYFIITKTEENLLKNDNKV